MNDDERREAERLADEKLIVNTHGDPMLIAKESYIAGYFAGRESRSGDLERAVVAASELLAERARSKKLAGFLKSLMLLQAPQAMQTEFWVEVSHELEANRE